MHQRTGNTCRTVGLKSMPGSFVIRFVRRQEAGTACTEADKQPRKAAEDPSTLRAHAPTPLDRLKHSLQTKESAAITADTRKTYERTFTAYKRWCAEHSLGDPSSATAQERYSIAGFLWWKAMRAENARSWAGWQSHITSYAQKTLRKLPLSREDEEFLRMHQKACAKSVGITVAKAEPVTEKTLLALWTKAKPASQGVRLFMIFLQLVIAKACTTRPGETCDTGIGQNADRLRAKDVTFIPEDEALGLPAAIELRLRNTKKIKLTGMGKLQGERAMAAEASIEHLCPVKAMAHIFKSYGLHDPGRAEEPVFALMAADGTRVYANPAAFTGATMISSKEVNQGITTLCAIAGIPRFTLRSTRHGNNCDMEAAGASEALANAAGRWAAGSRPPYSHMTIEAAAKVKDLMETMRARYR